MVYSILSNGVLDLIKCVFDFIEWCIRFYWMVYSILSNGVFDFIEWCIRFNQMCIRFYRMVYSILSNGVFDFIEWCIRLNQMCIRFNQMCIRFYWMVYSILLNGVFNFIEWCIQFWSKKIEQCCNIKWIMHKNRMNVAKISNECSKIERMMSKSNFATKNMPCNYPRPYSIFAASGRLHISSDHEPLSVCLL
jgi:hypothetical protein